MTHLPALTLALALVSATPLSAQKYLRAAEKQFELGEFAQAIEGLERYLEKDSDAEAERARLAHAYRMTGRLEEAAAEYNKLSRSSDPEIAFRQALTLMELGRYGAAVEKLAAAQRLGYPGVEAVATRLEYAQRNASQQSTWQVSNEFANSPADDFAPAVLGDRVVFASTRYGGEGLLYVAGRDENDFLQVPERLHDPLNAQGGDAPLAYGPGGQLVAYTRNNFTPGERLLPAAGWELNLQLATADEHGDFAGGKAFPFNGPGYSTGFPAFGLEGEKLYFASDRPGGYGGYDLYVSERTADGWGEPRNLGARVNTPGNEIAPSAADGAVYFSSDYHPGYGGMDVYRADLVGETAAAIVNLGAGVNSPLDDVGFTLAAGGELAYFASNRPGGKGGLDLYRAKRTGAALSLEVVDAKTGRAIPNAVLNFTDCGLGKFLTGVDGTYALKLTGGQSCEPSVLKPGYETKSFTIDAARLREPLALKLRLVPEDKTELFAGVVISSRGGVPLPDVEVRAEEIGGDYVALVTTDTSGRYALDFEPGKRYRVAYDAQGMADIDREVLATEGGGASVLSTFAMFPASPPAVAAPPAEQTQSVDDEAMLSAVEASADLSGITEPTDNRPDAAATAADEIGKGWAIQVAALNPDATDISAYRSRLERFGAVYGKREAGVLRVRVGPFPSRREAMARLSEVRALGYDDAFPAEETGGREALRGPLAPGEAEGVPPTAPTRPATADETYLIRLATYGNFANFDASKVSGLGSLTTRRSGEYVIVLLQGYDSLERAEERAIDAQAAGFEDAHVVRELADGTLRKL